MDEASPATMVKHVVHAIPRGRAASYGTVGRAVAALGRPIGGARTVAWILASLGRNDDTPWHRVVGAGGRILLPDRRGALQAARLRGEGVRSAKAAIEPGCLIAETELLSLVRRKAAIAERRSRVAGNAKRSFPEKVKETRGQIPALAGIRRPLSISARG